MILLFLLVIKKAHRSIVVDHVLDHGNADEDPPGDTLYPQPQKFCNTRKVLFARRYRQQRAKSMRNGVRGSCLSRRSGGRENRVGPADMQCH